MKETRFKMTELGLIPEDWECINLGSIGEPTMCKRILKEQTSKNDEIPFYKIGTFGKTADSFISRKLFLEFKSRYNYPKKGDILISAAGTIGRTVVFDGNDSYFQDSNIVWIEHNEGKITNPYLEISLQIINWSTTDGGTITRLYNKNLKESLIVIPPTKSEQTAIARALTDMDDLISSLKKLIEKKRNIKQGAMQQLLSGKQRLEGFEEPWVEKMLGEVCTFAKGNGLSKSKLSPTGLYPCVLYGEIFTTYDYEIKNCVSRTHYREGTLSNKGDVIMPSSTTTSGRDLAKAVAIHDDNFRLGGDIIIIRNTYNFYDEYFLAALITEMYKNRIEEVAHGTTIYHLRVKDIVNLRLSLPSLTEQTAIARILTDMDAELAALSAKLAKYEDLKQGMMQQLLTGKIRLI